MSDTYRYVGHNVVLDSLSYGNEQYGMPSISQPVVRSTLANKLATKTDQISYLLNLYNFELGISPQEQNERIIVKKRAKTYSGTKWALEHIRVEILC